LGEATKFIATLQADQLIKLAPVVVLLLALVQLLK